MHSSSSPPPILYLGDDDDDDGNISRGSSSNDMQLPRKKRKLTNANVRINSSMVNWSKRQRNDHYQHQPLQNFMDSDPEPILLDPDEYIIEEPDTHSFRSFDWTIQTRPPTPPPPPLLATRISSNSLSKPSRVSTMNVNHTTKRPVDKPDMISTVNLNDKVIQQQRKPMNIPPPRPSLAVLALPLPKLASPTARLNNRRGRPVKNSRVPYPQSTSPPSPFRQPLDPQILSQTSRSLPSTSSTVPTVTTTSPTNDSTLEFRRQILNGTGLFSAYHDSKYYQCNICKFKSVTSSTLLQHLFTHMFFCEQCSFYTYSHYNLSQHMYEKHASTIIEPTQDPSNPKSFDQLYVTRCSDGTFALCMDTSAPASNKVPASDQRLIISSATFNDQAQTKTAKKKLSKQKEIINEEDNDIVLLSEKRDTNRRSLIQLKGREKQYQSYVLIKHRKSYSLKKPFCLHALTLEYNICREHTIRHMCHTQDILNRRTFLTNFKKTRLIDEVADCLRTLVNDIVEREENSRQTSFVCALPNDILDSILSTDNLRTLTNALKLNNKYDRYMEQKKLYNHEHILRESRQHMFVLSSPEVNHNEQSIISSLHSSMTNGDSIFTQTKLNKSSASSSNAQQYSKKSSNIQSPINNSKSKVQKKINTIQPPPLPPPKIVPLRSAMPKPSHPLPNPSLPTIIDRNNNSVPSSTSKTTRTKTSNVIILD